MAVRVTNHSGRVGKKGVYSAKHNDRNFSLKNAKHIDPNRSSENVYWKFNEEKIPLSERNPDTTFDEHESLIYDALFSTQLAKINSNYMKQRHKEKVQSMKHFRTENRQYCPEETLMYLGNSEECVSPEILKNVFEEYRKWHEETFPMCLWLDAAMHLDERTPHIHERHVWTAMQSCSPNLIPSAIRFRALPNRNTSEEENVMQKLLHTMNSIVVSVQMKLKPLSWNMENRTMISIDSTARLGAVRIKLFPIKSNSDRCGKLPFFIGEASPPLIEGLALEYIEYIEGRGRKKTAINLLKKLSM